MLCHWFEYTFAAEKHRYIPAGSSQIPEKSVHIFLDVLWLLSCVDERQAAYLIVREQLGIGANITKPVAAISSTKDTKPLATRRNDDCSSAVDHSFHAPEGSSAGLCPPMPELKQGKVRFRKRSRRGSELSLEAFLDGKKLKIESRLGSAPESVHNPADYGQSQPTAHDKLLHLQASSEGRVTATRNNSELLLSWPADKQPVTIIPGESLMDYHQQLSLTQAKIVIGKQASQPQRIQTAVDLKLSTGPSALAGSDNLHRKGKRPKANGPRRPKRLSEASTFLLERNPIDQGRLPLPHPPPIWTNVRSSDSINKE